MVLATWGPLIFRVNVRMNFSISVKKKRHWDLYTLNLLTCIIQCLLVYSQCESCTNLSDSRTLSSFPKEARTYQQSLHLALSHHQYTFCLDLPIPDIFFLINSGIIDYIIFCDWLLSLRCNVFKVHPCCISTSSLVAE